MINQVIIKKKSEELGISFANLLAGSLLETVIGTVSQWDEQNILWLVNRNETGLSAYKDKRCECLYYVCGKKPIPKEELRAYLIEKISDLGIDIACEQEDYGLRAVLCVDGLRGIVNIFIEENHIKGVNPKEDSLQLFTENNKTVPVLLYPTEQVLSSLIFEIVEKLELINDMSAYAQVYRILESKSVNGRKVRECLINLTEESGMKISSKTMDMLEYYGRYTYMKKKWTSYSKKNNMSDVLWEDVINCLLTFTRPIWKSIETGEVFLGDWMPGLKRFLD